MPPKGSKKKAPTKVVKKPGKKTSKKKAIRGKNEMKLSLAKLTPVAPQKDLRLDFKVLETPFKGPSSLLDSFNSNKLPEDAKKEIYREPDTPVLPPSLQPLAQFWRRVTDLVEDQKANLQIFVPLAPEDKRACYGVYGTEYHWCQVIAGVLNMMVNLRGKMGGYPWELFHPRDKSGQPKFSEKGRYCLRLYYQDEWKLLTIDDRVPVTMHGAAIYPASNNPMEVSTITITILTIDITSP
jgi:hypothetical protein